VTRLLQHLQRRAFVLLAWLVLAVAVPAPVFASAEAPVAVLIAPRAAQVSVRAAAQPRSEASARPSRKAAERRPTSSPAGIGGPRGALPHAAGQAPSRDERHLYLETLTLLC
jgi:hypothetical protein